MSAVMCSICWTTGSARSPTSAACAQSRRPVRRRGFRRYELPDRNRRAGTASWNFAGTNPTDCIEVSGTRGKLTLAAFADEPLRIYTDGAWQSVTIPQPRHVHQPLVATIVADLLAGPNAQPTCPSTGVTATRTAAVMDEVTNDFYGNRDPDFWNRALNNSPSIDSNTARPSTLNLTHRTRVPLALPVLLLDEGLHVAA